MTPLSRWARHQSWLLFESHYTLCAADTHTKNDSVGGWHANEADVAWLKDARWRSPPTPSPYFHSKQAPSWASPNCFPNFCFESRRAGIRENDYLRSKVEISHALPKFWWSQQKRLKLDSSEFLPNCIVLVTSLSSSLPYQKRFRLSKFL